MKQQIKIPLEERFWNKVKKTPYCWLWTASTKNTGYGQFGIKTKKPRTRYAHRVAYELTYGKIPSKLFVCHKCDNPLCVNSKHLFLGTNKDNMQDAKRKGRTTKGRINFSCRGELNPSSKLSIKDIKKIRKLFIKRKTDGQIGKIFNITKWTVFHIRHKNTWSWVK